MRTITVTEAARGFADIINRVLYRKESALLIRGGRPVAKIVPADTMSVRNGRDIAAMWGEKPILNAQEAEAFALDIISARAALTPPVDKWG